MSEEADENLFTRKRKTDSEALRPIKSNSIPNNASSEVERLKDDYQANISILKRKHEEDINKLRAALTEF